MDIINIKQLQVSTIIGTYTWERKLQQNLSIDLAFATDVSAATTSDNLADAIDYTAITEAISTFAQQHSYQLLEAFAANLIDTLKQTFNLNWIKLTVTKPAAIKQAQGVAITLER